MAEDAVYRNAFEDVRPEAEDMIEAKCWRWAVQGFLAPVFYKGKKFGTYRRYNDALLMWLLKARTAARRYHVGDERCATRAA